MFRDGLIVAVICAATAGAFGQPRLGANAVADTAGQDRASATQKGSVLIYPKVELRWNASGNLIQDTFISLGNDYTQDVTVLSYFVAETGEVAYTGFDLTRNEPAYWSAATGLPKGISPITAARDPYPDPEGSTDYVLRGYLIVFPINAAFAQIRWNHVYGTATVVHYASGTAWDYNAYAFRAVVDSAGMPPHGEPVGSPGIINLDGLEFDSVYQFLILDFVTSQSTAFSGGGLPLVHDTDLTLAVADTDLRLTSTGLASTCAHFFTWNEDEWSFSTHFCVNQWSERSLRLCGQHFLVQNLQTNKARSRLSGIAFTGCPDSGSRALLGVAAKVITAPTGKVALAGSNLVGTGTRCATIRYDVPPPPPEQFLRGQLPAEGGPRAPHQ